MLDWTAALLVVEAVEAAVPLAAAVDEVLVPLLSITTPPWITAGCAVVAFMEAIWYAWMVLGPEAAWLMTIDIPASQCLPCEQ